MTTRSVLSELPSDALLALLSHLGPHDLLRFGATCRAFHEASRSDCLWMAMCRRAWEQTIPISSWRARLDSAEALFRLLSAFDPLVGAWTLHGREPRGSLVYVTWGDLSLSACEVYGYEDEELKLKLFFEATGHQNGSFEVKIVNRSDTDSAVTRVPARLLWRSKEEPEFFLQLTSSSGAFSQTKEASEVQGASTMHRFVQGAWQTFLQPKSPTNEEENGKWLFSKVKVMEPSAGNELAGLWRGVYGPHGVEIINISESAGEILGTKILGDPNVPCGQVSFKASLSLESSDVSEDLQRIVDFQLRVDASEFRIEKVLMGHGRIAEHNFENPLWVPGLLLVSEKGSVAFLWGQVNFVIPFERLDLPEFYHLQCLSGKIL